MNKLEELKALRVKRATCPPEPSDEREYLELMQEYNELSAKIDVLTNELLPQLIAVTEAAQAVDWYGVFVKNDEERNCINVLRNALLPLTKDADK